MLVNIAMLLIGLAVGGLFILWVERESFDRISDEAQTLEKALQDALNAPTAVTPGRDGLTFVPVDPTKRKPGRPRKVQPAKEPVVLTRQTGRRTH